MSEKRYNVIAAVGAGGKTTLLHQLADRYLQEGKKVLLITTTHMLVEEDMVLFREDQRQIFYLQVKEKITDTGYCMAGNPISPVKFTRLPEEVESEIFPLADIVLIEADGSNCHPAKIPGKHEPVLPLETDQVFVILGREALGKPAEEVLHRSRLNSQILGITEKDPITGEHFQKIFQIYQKKIEASNPAAECICLEAWMQNGKRCYETV